MLGFKIIFKFGVKEAAYSTEVVQMQSNICTTVKQWS